MCMSQPMYLKENVQVEPLVDQWYAWSYLIPPANYARCLTERHFRILDSYLSAPQVHAAAVKNPKLLGGPFVDYGGERVEEIRELRRITAEKRTELVDMSKAISEVDELLRNEAKGMALQTIYDKVPGCLKGYVELAYDLNNHPSFRLREALLYRSQFYVTDAQSVMLSEITGDDRPFVLSTPRLESDKCVHIAQPFASRGLDMLFEMKTRARKPTDIADELGLGGAELTELRKLLKAERSSAYKPYGGPGVRWRYFGHACILVETNGATLVIDPVLSYTYESGVSRYTYEDLPEEIDYVLISHNHQDHVLLETLLQLRHKIRHIIVPRSGGGSLQDPSLKLVLEAIGFRNIIEIGDLEEVRIDKVSVTGLPFIGEHADLDVRSKAGYLVRVGHHKLMFMADSCNIQPELYKHLSREVGDVDVLFIGMECDGAPLTWLYGPLLTRNVERAVDQSRRLSGSNYEQAIDMVDTFGCREVYVYAMGQEPWLNYIMSIKYTEESRPIIESNKLIAECKRRGIVAERLFGEKEILLATE